MEINKNVYSKRLAHGVAVVVAAVWLGGFLGASPSCMAEGRKVVDRIVAVVNDDIVSLYQVNAALKPYADRIKETHYTQAQEREELFRLRKEIIGQLINQKLADQEIKRLNIAVQEQEIDNHIERIKEENSLTDEQLREVLATQGMSMDFYRRELKEEMHRAKLVNRAVKSKIVISDDDIKAYYDAHVTEYRGKKKYHLRNILMRYSEYGSQDEKQQVYDRMAVVLKKFESGTPFADLARAYSESSLASDGGDLGVFSTDKLAPQIAKAIDGMAEGEATPILDTDQGYQLVYIQEIIQTADKTMDAAAPEIEKKLYKTVVEKKYKAWLKRLQEQAYIKLIN